MNRQLSVVVLVAVLVAISSSIATIAQDNPDGDQTAPVEGIIGGILEGIGGDISSSIQIEAITDDGTGPVRMFSIGDGGGMGIGPADPMSLVGMSQIQKELELVDEQQEKLRQIRADLNSKMTAQMRDRFKGGALRFDAEAMTKWQEEMKKLKADALTQIDEVLLPQQRDRLRQLVHHVELKRSGTQDALLDGKLAEELEITEEQRIRLREKAEAIEKEMAAEIARLKAKARDDLFAELTPQQQRKLKELLGDDFEYEQTDWRKRIREMQRRNRP